MIGHPRPYVTQYYENRRRHPTPGPNEAPAKSTRSVTADGALRAAIIRVVHGQYNLAEIYDETGLMQYAIVRQRHGGIRVRLVWAGG